MIYEVVVLNVEDKYKCPVYKFDSWTRTVDFLYSQLINGYSCEVNYCVQNINSNFTNNNSI